MIEPSTVTLALEVLRKTSPMALKDIAEAIDVSSVSLSTALSRAIAEGQPVRRVDRGVYAIKETREILGLTNDNRFILGDEEKDAQAESDYVEETTPRPEVKEAGRIRRVRQRIKDLESALDDLSFYMTKIEAKARAYDKIQFAMNGVVVDPL